MEGGRSAAFCNFMGYLERKMIKILKQSKDWWMMCLSWLLGVSLIGVKLEERSDT